MIGFVTDLLSRAGIEGMLVGAIAMFFCKPLVIAGFNKLIRKNT